MEDIRDYIFRNISSRHYRCNLKVERDGIISGMKEAMEAAEKIGIGIEYIVSEGTPVKKGEVIAIFHATPKQVGMADELFIGCLAKYSGIATAAKRAVSLSGGCFEIASGAWKKMPHELKDKIRRAAEAGGVCSRIAPQPMIYLDKNAIRMFGSVAVALENIKDLTDYQKVVQIRGEKASIKEETCQAIEHGGNLLMVDTGITEDLEICINTVNAMNYREKVRIAFAGDIKLDMLEGLRKYDIDTLCIGKEIVDAPLLDMKLDVIEICKES